MVPRAQNVFTVPTALQRGGDFSQTLNTQGQLIQLYDPLTTRQSGSGYVRDPFPGNKLPADRMSQIAKNYLQYWPTPNLPGDPITGVRNFLRPTTMSFQDDSWHVKSDYLWNQNHRTTATITQSWGIIWGNTRGMDNSNPGADGYIPGIRNHEGTVVEHTWTASPTMVVTGRASWDRWMELLTANNAQNYDGSSLGFQGVVSPYGTHFPSVTIDGQMPLGGVAPSQQWLNNYFLVLDTFKTAGRHNIKFGVRFSETRDNTANLGQNLGSFSFDTAFTRRNPQLSEPNAGYGLGTFLLGYPASGSVATQAVKNHAYGSYIQDDIKVTRKLTLNIGLRWDIQTPGVERYDRTTRTFDPNAAYDLNGVPVKGGLVYADSSHRTRFDTHFRDFQPRLGVAYQLPGKTILRASYGLSFLPENADKAAVYGKSMDQTGLSRSTPYNATLGSGINSYIPNLPGTGTFAVPFPNGILQPIGGASGPKTNVGQGVGYIYPDYVIPRVHQFSVGLQHDFPWKVTMEVAYSGSRTRKMAVSRSLNYVPLEEQMKSFGDANYWNQTAANPFYGAPELVGTGYNAATFGRAVPMYQYPQFSQVTISGLPVGFSSYDALQVKANKRLSQGFLLSASYTYSKLMTANSYRTNWDSDVFRQVDPQDRPHHFTMAVLWDVPVGRGKLLGKNWGRLPNGILGGWQYNAAVEKASGSPIAMPGFSVNDPLNPMPTDGRYFQTCTQLLNRTRYGCTSTNEPIYWRQANYNEIATYSTNWSRVRVPTRPTWNMSLFKKFPLWGERVNMEWRTEFINAFNTPQYGAAGTTMTATSFAIVQRDQWNPARNIQFAARILF